MPTKTVVPSVEELIAGIRVPEGFTSTVEEGGYDHPNIEELKRLYPDQYDRSWSVLKLDSEDIWIEIDFSAYPNLGGEHKSPYLGYGHVSFDTTMGKRSFDRYGVEDSFYINNPAKSYRNEKLAFYESDRVVHGLKEKLGTVISGAGYRGWGEDRKWIDEFIIHWDDEEEPETFTKRRLSRNKVVLADAIEQTNATIRRFIEERIPASRTRLADSERVPSIPFTVTSEKKSEYTKRLRRGKSVQFTPSGFGTGYRLSSRAGRGHRPPGGWAKPGSPELAQFFGVKTIYVETLDCD